MASHRRPKQPTRARVTLFGATAAAAAALTSQPAQAEPTLDDVQERVDTLYEDAEAATEKYNGAKEREEELEEEIEELQDSAARGQEELNELRTGVGSFAAAQYRNGGLDPSVQLFLSTDPDAYLERASALDQVGGRQAETLRLIESKQRTLTQQRREATRRLGELEGLRDELNERKRAIQEKLKKAQELLNRLTEEERARLAAERAAEAARLAGDIDLNGAATTYARDALEAARRQIGRPYVWGASGPDSFDCSGLTQWSYAQAGVDLPRISQDQAYAGTKISIDQVRPGDLVIYYDDMHHVGIAANSSEIIHAPRPGESVTFAPLNSMPAMWAVRIG